jgi:hypothetical protein
MTRNVELFRRILIEIEQVPAASGRRLKSKARRLKPSDITLS